jgi:DNA-binding ferritin-like protein
VISKADAGTESSRATGVFEGFLSNEEIFATVDELAERVRKIGGTTTSFDRAYLGAT